MKMLQFMTGIFSLSLTLSSAGIAFAQNFPIKPLRLITAEPGGSNDIIARTIAHAMSPSLGQQVIVENRGGAGGIIAAQTLIRAPADGYTILLYSSTIVITPLLRNKVPYDPLRDFAPITLAVISPTVLVVHPSLPVKTVKELIALAKARPGEMNFTGTTGSMNHLAGELFKSRAHITIVHVPHRGTSQALNDLVPGRVQVYFANASAVMAFIKAGKLRALAVTSRRPSPLLPGIPTVADSGLPGYEAVVMFSVFAPATTPAALINRLHQEIVKGLNSPDVKARFANAMVEIVASTPEELADTVKTETAKLGQLIKDIGLRQ